MVDVFMRVNPVGRVQIQGDMQIAVVYVGQQFIGIGNQVGVPAPSCPPSATA